MFFIYLHIRWMEQKKKNLQFLRIGDLGFYSISTKDPDDNMQTGSRTEITAYYYYNKHLRRQHANANLAKNPESC